MNIDVALDFPNKDSFLAKMLSFLPELQKEMEKAVGRSAIMIQDRAKEILTTIEWVTKSGLRRQGGQYYPAGSAITGHVDTGNLRRNIKSQTGWVSPVEIVAIIGTDVPYAPYVEALPDGGFLYRAAMEKADDAFKYLQKELNKILEA